MSHHRLTTRQYQIIREAQQKTTVCRAKPHGQTMVRQDERTPRQNAHSQAGAAVTPRACARFAPAALDAVQIVMELLATRRFRHVRMHGHWRVLRAASLSVDLASMLIAQRPSAPVERTGCPRGLLAAIAVRTIATANKHVNAWRADSRASHRLPPMHHRRNCSRGYPVGFSEAGR